MGEWADLIFFNKLNDITEGAYELQLTSAMPLSRTINNMTIRLQPAVKYLR